MLEPPRVTETTASVLDLIFVDCSEYVCSGISQSSIPALIENDQIYSDALSKATLLNVFFTANSCLEPPPAGFALRPLLFKSDLGITTIEFSPIAVYKVLKTLPTAKANGPDNISNRFLCEWAGVLAEPFAMLF